MVAKGHLDNWPENDSESQLIMLMRNVIPRVEGDEDEIDTTDDFYGMGSKQ